MPKKSLKKYPLKKKFNIKNVDGKRKVKRVKPRLKIIDSEGEIINPKFQDISPSFSSQISLENTEGISPVALSPIENIRQIQEFPQQFNLETATAEAPASSDREGVRYNQAEYTEQNYINNRDMHREGWQPRVITPALRTETIEQIREPKFQRINELDTIQKQRKTREEYVAEVSGLSRKGAKLPFERERKYE